MALIPNPRNLRSAIRAGVAHLRRDSPPVSRLTADIYERPDDFWICLDAPGVEEGDVQVRYVDDAVLVRMDRFRPPREDVELTVSGRAVGFDGRVEIPTDAPVAAEQATATLRTDGTLVVELPKTTPEPSGDDIVDETIQDPSTDA